MQKIAHKAPPRFQTAHRMRLPAGWRMDAHQHPFWECLLVLSGTHSVVAQDMEAATGAGGFLLYPPGMAHAEWNPRREDVDAWYLAFEYDEAGGSPALRRGYDRDGRLGEMLGWLDAERDAYGPAAAAFRDAMVQAIWAEHLRLGVRREASLVDAVRRYVHDRLAEPIRLDDLAGAAGVSKYHFVRAYRRLTGVTPMQDLRRLRVEQARRLLVSTQRPLKTIALEVGMRDEYQLSRALKRCLGMSARAIRTRADG